MQVTVVVSGNIIAFLSLSIILFLLFVYFCLFIFGNFFIQFLAVGSMNSELVCKFVYVENEKEPFGESIDVYRSMLIVKSGSKFYAVPLENIEKTKKDSIYLKKFDKTQAEKVGKVWIKEKSKPVSFEELRKYGFGEENEKLDNK